MFDFEYIYDESESKTFIFNVAYIEFETNRIIWTCGGYDDVRPMHILRLSIIIWGMVFAPAFTRIHALIYRLPRLIAGDRCCHCFFFCDIVCHCVRWQSIVAAN